MKILRNLHRAQFDSGSEDENPNTMARPLWIYGHDCQQHTDKEFHKALEAVVTGRKYVSSNIPADGVYRLVDEGKDIAGTICQDHGHESSGEARNAKEMSS